MPPDRSVGYPRPMTDEPLPRGFYERDALSVARAALGCVVVCDGPEGRTAGRIVETEAYGGAEDAASHAARARAGNALAMWGPPGIAYVYRSYGLHAMLNLVVAPEGTAAAVLVRALEPLVGLDLMRARRGVAREPLLCAGPGRLCQALGITLADHGTDLTRTGRLWLAPGPPPATILTGPRVGISRAVDRPWRFWEAGNPHVSGTKGGRVIG